MEQGSNPEKLKPVLPPPLPSDPKIALTGWVFAIGGQGNILPTIQTGLRSGRPSKYLASERLHVTAERRDHMFHSFFGEAVWYRCDASRHLFFSGTSHVGIRFPGWHRVPNASTNSLRHGMRFYVIPTGLRTICERSSLCMNVQNNRGTFASIGSLWKTE